MTRKKTKLVTFTRWCLNEKDRTSISINPAEVSNIEDYCGSIEPGQLITLKNKKTFLIQGAHAEVVARLNEEENDGD